MLKNTSQVSNQSVWLVSLLSRLLYVSVLQVGQVGLGSCARRLEGHIGHAEEQPAMEVHTGR